MYRTKFFYFKHLTTCLAAPCSVVRALGNRYLKGFRSITKIWLYTLLSIDCSLYVSTTTPKFGAFS